MTLVHLLKFFTCVKYKTHIKLRVNFVCTVSVYTIMVGWMTYEQILNFKFKFTRVIYLMVIVYILTAYIRLIHKLKCNTNVTSKGIWYNVSKKRYMLQHRLKCVGNAVGLNATPIACHGRYRFITWPQKPWNEHYTHHQNNTCKCCWKRGDSGSFFATNKFD